MSGADLLLATLALGLGLVLAWQCVPPIRALLFVSTLLVSALLFVPEARLEAWVGAHRVEALDAMAARTPWALPEWVHLVAFFWLAMLLWVGCRQFRSWPGLLLLGTLACAAEMAQWLTESRQARLGDAGVNLLGVAAGVLLGAMWNRLSGKAPDDVGHA